MSAPLRVETRLDAHSHRDDLLAVQVLAAKRDDPAPLTVRALAVELSGRGIALSTGELIEVANICLAAEAYAGRIGLVTDRLRAGVDPRD